MRLKKEKKSIWDGWTKSQQAFGIDRSGSRSRGFRWCAFGWGHTRRIELLHEPRKLVDREWKETCARMAPALLERYQELARKLRSSRQVSPEGVVIIANDWLHLLPEDFIAIDREV